MFSLCNVLSSVFEFATEKFLFYSSSLQKKFLLVMRKFHTRHLFRLKCHNEENYYAKMFIRKFGFTKKNRDLHKIKWVYEQSC